MKKILIFIFLINQLAFGNYEIIGNPYGTDKKDFQHPISIQNEGENIYVMDYVLGKIVIMNKNFEILDTIEGLNNPIAFKIIDNHIYISESNNNKILKINKTNKNKTVIGKYDMRRNNFNHPGNIYGFSNRIFIFDEYNYRIQILNENDDQIDIINLPVFKYIYTPYYKTNYSMVKKDNRFYVLDSYNKKVHIIKENITESDKINYELENTINTFGIDFPNKIFQNKGNIYIFDERQEKIYDFTVTTKKIQLDEENPEDFNVERSYDISLKYDVLENMNNNLKQNEIIQANQLYITDNKLIFLRKNEIISFKIDGNKANKIKKEKHLKEIKSYEYINPVDIFVDKEKKIYVLDEDLDKILIFDKDGKFLRNIENIGKNPTGIGIGKDENIYVASSKDNQIIKYSKYGKELRRYGDYEEFSIYNPLSKEDENEDNSKLKYNFDISLSNENIYVMDSGNMNIEKFNYFFQKKSSMGKPASLFSVLKKELKPGEFGWDGFYKNNLTDIFVYKRKLYALDQLYKRINIFDNSLFKNGEFEGYYTDDFGDMSIKGIYISDDSIYITDSKKFRILKYNLDFENKKIISFVNDNLIPIKIYGNYMIAAKETLNYQRQYLVLNIEEYLNDKNTKSKSNN